MGALEDGAVQKVGILENGAAQRVVANQILKYEHCTMYLVQCSSPDLVGVRGNRSGWLAVVNSSCNNSHSVYTCS